mmetsp:Transcript_5620/g.16729  ORF Transcript_5620/g.16729 Transcript_5620/m.16729 type:complete len:192 (+) Transcript_5620:109-684(+)
MGVHMDVSGRRVFERSMCALMSVFLSGMPVALRNESSPGLLLSGLSLAFGLILGWLLSIRLPGKIREVSLLSYLAMSVGAAALTMGSKGPVQVIGCVAVNLASGSLYLNGMLLVILWMIKHMWAAMYLSLMAYALGILFGVAVLLPALSAVAAVSRVTCVLFVVLVPGIFVSRMLEVPIDDEDGLHKGCAV